MVSQSVSLGVEPHLRLMTRYLLLFDSYGLVFVGHKKEMKERKRRQGKKKWKKGLKNRCQLLMNLKCLSEGLTQEPFKCCYLLTSFDPSLIRNVCLSRDKFLVDREGCVTYQWRHVCWCPPREKYYQNSVFTLCVLTDAHELYYVKMSLCAINLAPLHQDVLGVELQLHSSSHPD
jgi:hypothetical protein